MTAHTNRTIWKQIVLLVTLAIVIAAAGCIAPDEPEATEPQQPDYPDPLEMEMTAPTATPTETATPHHIVDINTPIDDRTNWQTCDPRHNESWLYQHECGMYSGGGSAEGPPPPIPELPTYVSFAIGIAGCVIAARRNT